MTDVNQDRYTIARQTYIATHNIHGSLKDIEPAQIPVQFESDSQRAAETVVDLAMGDIGVVFLLIDRDHTDGHIAVFAQENEERGALLRDVIDQMEHFSTIENLTV